MKNEFNKVLFIINKFSGRQGFQDAVDGAIVRACEKESAICTIEFTRARGHATELAREAARSGDFSYVVAVGGDGTVNEVAQALVNTDTPMGILPKGSGNGLARHLGVSMNIRLALQMLFKSKAIAIDTFLLNGRLSLNVSGIGFDGHVANMFGKEKKRGLQGYARVTLNEFLSFHEFSAKVTVDDQVSTRNAFVIAIANSSQYGNNARIAPAASVSDGILHVCFLKKVPPYRLDFVVDFFRGKIDQSSFCDVVTGQRVQIVSDQPIAYHIDGEACGAASAFDIKILPASLKMLVPPSSLKP